MRTILLSLGLALFGLAPSASPQSAGAAKLKTGKEIFEAGCAGCHGYDGAGAAESTTVFERPETFPDFTKCDQTTPEDNATWKSIVRDGGPSRSFSQIMPSFSGALTSPQMDAVIGYLRGFCREKGWPRGELNLPRALATEKAFPEDEEVITGTFNTRAPGIAFEIAHEQRFGIKNQLELSIPVGFQRPQRGLWYGGVGDIGVGWKRLLFSNLNSGSILAVQGEWILPTGNVAHGLGTGTPIFESFAAFDQLLPKDSFVQLQGGSELPVDSAKTPKAVFFRSAFGKSLRQSEGLGRVWTPMVEALMDRDLETGASTNWDIVPQFQVTLSKRQHVRFDVGYRIPATNRAGRQGQVMFYVLWDWADGKLFEGWK